MPVMLTNGYGLICALYYGSVFVRFDETSARARNRQMLMGLGAFIFVVLVGSMADHVSATPLVGLMASGISIAVFASPLAQLAHIVRTRSAASLSFPFALASTLSASLWTAFGYFSNDANIWVPNFIAVLLSASQLALFVIFGGGNSSNSKLAAFDDV
jgi:solute carrier family 50 protein (sugar transporter)